MKLTKQQAYQELGERRILWINPECITHDAGSKWLVTKHLQRGADRLLAGSPKLRGKAVRKLRRSDPFIIPGICFRRLRPVEQEEKYLRMKELIEHRDDVTGTRWYRMLVRELADRGYARHKQLVLRSEGEIRDFFVSYVFPLIDSMRDSGYLMEKNSVPGSAVVGADGELYKCGSGSHRFYAARLTGVSSFPVAVAGVHRRWFARKCRRDRWQEDILTALQKVEKTNQ